MKKAEDLKKSRYGRISNKRKFNEELDISLGESYRKINFILTKKSNGKSSPTAAINNMSNGKRHIFNVGDMVWAKTGKYPVWPGIVITDPETNKFSKNDNMVPMLHIYYCNDAYKRNWIKMKQISKFSGKEEILAEIPKITTQISRSKLKIKWNQAVEEAECLAAMNKDQRISSFFANNFLASNSRLINKAESSTGEKAPIKQPSMLEKNVVIKQPSMLEKNVVIKQPSMLEKNVVIKQPSMLEKNVVIKQPSMLEKTVVIKQPSMLGKNVAMKEPSMLETNVASDHEQWALINDDSEEHPRNLIPELCRQFYANGWVTGTGGGISVKFNNQIFIAPSGVQKERIQPDDLFVQNLNGEDIIIPKPEKNLTKSQCTPIFMCSFTERNAGAVIHVHSPKVVKLCLLNPESEVKITGLEMIKGIYNEKKGRFYDNDEELIIPIIENSKYEKDLVDTFKIALKKYPCTSAVLVRNHGMYVWGSNWKTAKTQLECYEYLFKIAIFKKIHNI